MTGPESCTAHQISRSELLICVYESVLRPGRPDSQEGVPGVWSWIAKTMSRTPYKFAYKFHYARNYANYAKLRGVCKSMLMWR